MPTYPTTPEYGYPLSRAMEFKTQVVTHEDGSEQRWPMTPGEERWVIQYADITLAERDALFGFFDARQGSAGQDISLVFAGETFEGLNIDADRLAATEGIQKRWDMSVTLSQAVRPVDAGELAADFPALEVGLVQLPFTYERAWLTDVVRTDGGRYVNSRRVSSLRTWTAGGTDVSDDDAQAIWDMFSRARGRHAEFGFTDPDSLVRYGSCRFASDTLEWRYIAKNSNAIEVQIQQLA